MSHMARHLRGRSGVPAHLPSSERGVYTLSQVVCCDVKYQRSVTRGGEFHTKPLNLQKSFNF